MKLNTLEKVLNLIKEGKKTPDEIARELNMKKEDVEAAIEILKSLGYIEEVQKGSSPACETCPMKKICGGKCFVPRKSGNLKIIEFKVKD
ncbi:DNA-binding protein [Thermococcus sp.]|uniref:DNA-binding protein n=1 Tax=Thermococcus sp. TaxID=35749 RepID=UPI003459C14A